MRLFFLRHGIAEDRGPGKSDFQRRLTEEGLKEMDGVGKGMRRLNLGLDLVLTSPLVRARETAEIAAKALDLEKALKTEERLASGCNFADLQQALSGVPDQSRVLLVGHEPDLSEFVGHLIGGGSVRMKKASLACVDVDAVQPGYGCLRWLLEAEQMVQIGA
jgi:phosphohistidine phosphatase